MDGESGRQIDGQMMSEWMWTEKVKGYIDSYTQVYKDRWMYSSVGDGRTDW